MSKAQNPLLKLTTVAATDVAEKRFMGYDGNYAAAAGVALGVTDYAVSATREVALVTMGTAVVEAGGVIAEGAAVEVGTDGKAVAQSAGVVVGRALDASAADGNYITIVLIGN